MNPFMPRLNSASMPTKLPFLLEVFTALERHTSWNYLGFCGHFSSDWSSGETDPDTDTVRIRQFMQLLSVAVDWLS